MIMKATEMSTLVLCPSHMQIGVISVPLPEGFDLLLLVVVGISPSWSVCPPSSPT